MKKLITLTILTFGVLEVEISAQTTGAGTLGGGAGTLGIGFTYIGNSAGNSNTTTGNYNTFLGREAGYNNTDQDDNVYIGYRSGYNSGFGDNDQKSSQNVFVGSLSGFSNTNGGNNTFVGFKAGYWNVSGLANSYYGVYAGIAGTGGGNSIFGFEAGFNNTADDNSFFGKRAGWGNTTGLYNSAFGTQAMYTNATGNANTSMGYQAGLGSSSGSNSSNSFFGYRSGYSISTGSNNCFIGSMAGNINTSGASNTFLGYEAGSSNTTASNNVFIGYQAGNTNTTGTTNTIVGYGSDVGNSALTNASAFGANAIVRNSNHMILGDNNAKVGINLSNDATGPLSVLSVGGNGSASYELYSFQPSTGDGSIAIKGEVNATGTAGSANKVYGVTGVANAWYGYSYGAYGSAYKSTAHQNGRSYGVYGIAGNCTNMFNYGVYGTITGSNTGFAGYFDGLVRTTNDNPEKVTSGSWTGYSDERLKENVQPFEDGLDVLRQINPVTYQFNGIGGLDDSSTFIGVIAQDVQQVAPYCVGTSQMIVSQTDAGAFGSDVVMIINDSTPEAVVNVMNYNYDGLIYVMINSIKQLDSTVAALQAQVENPSGLRMIDSTTSLPQGQYCITTFQTLQTRRRQSIIMFLKMLFPLK